LRLRPARDARCRQDQKLFADFAAQGKAKYQFIQISDQVTAP
jgi:hypothetical protein